MRKIKPQNSVHRILLVMVSFSLTLSLIRVIHTGSIHYLFLIWNLFLAIIPYLITSRTSFTNNRRYQTRISLIVWILFFPNAPYILTDLFHLRLNSQMPIWFDLILLLSYAWTGLVFGFLSLTRIEHLLSSKLSQNTTTLCSIGLLYLASFGIYIGRYLRWNSWDILNNPLGLFNDLSIRILHPTDHPRTWGMTILMGTLLCIIHFTLKTLSFNNQKCTSIKTQ